MKILHTNIQDLILIKPDIFKDDRGYFYESYNNQKIKDLGINYDFVQDNESKSKVGVLRGLHFQLPPFEQGKLVRDIKGKDLDVADDLRKKSSTFGQHFKIILSEKNHLMFWIPPGFAHGFLSLSDDTIFSYKCTNYYNKQSEASLLWNDPILNINWPMKDPILSEKDSMSILFKDFENPF